MKRKHLQNALAGTLLGWITAFSAVACPLTGFELNASLTGIGLWLLLFAAVCGLCLTLRRGGLIPLALLVLWTGRLWYKGELLPQIQSLLRNITGRYNGAYNTGILCLSAENGPQGPVELPLLVLGCLSAFLICRTVMKKGSLLGPLVSTVPLLVVCLVVTDTPPHPAALFGLLAGLILLLLADWSRRHNGDGGIRLLALAALPVAAALGILFLSQPREDYVNHAETLRQSVVTLAEQLRSLAEEVPKRISGSGDAATGGQVDLRTLGPRTQWSYRVMDVTSPVSGTLYLRGQDYNTYTGTGWTASRHRSELFTAGGEALGTLTVETYGVKDLLYSPYYPAEDLTLVGGSLPNTEKASSYSFTLTAPPAATEYRGDGSVSDLLLLAGSASSTPDSGYRLLPTDTLRWAKDLAGEIIEGHESVHDRAAAIGSYVRSSAGYDLKTGRMDTDCSDFARWFLEESDTGYCVHFATAATVLLRAADIPARYVEGYLVRCEAGQETTVTAKSAHAWAEYYAGGAWHVLEATPAEENRQETSSTPETGPTDPEETRAPVQTPEPDPSRADIPEIIPAAEDTSPSGGEEISREWPGWLKTAGWLFLAMGVLWGQSAVRIDLKERAWNRGGPNEMALNRWARVRHLGSLARLPIPEELEQAAQKAKFSQHTLTPEELDGFDGFRESCREALRKKGPAAALLLRLIFGEAV